MTIFRGRHFLFGSLLAIVLSVSIGSTDGQAYTPEQQQACTGDAFRLCSSDIPDVDRITACMIRNNAAQGRERQAAQNQEAGQARDLTAQAA